MSTRATIHFVYPGEETPAAIIYRHSDGYVTGLGQDLTDFVKDISKHVKDNRFNDPGYLAAKWVVWDTQMRYRPQMRKVAKMVQPSTYKVQGSSEHPCDFLGCGVVMEDPFDIAYRYTVLCDGTPAIMVQECGGSAPCACGKDSYHERTATSGCDPERLTFNVAEPLSVALPREKKARDERERERKAEARKSKATK